LFGSVSAFHVSMAGSAEPCPRSSKG
jgi:hypothetical protein